MNNMVNRIKKLVIDNNISIAELERIIGISNGRIKRWESSIPGIDKVNLIAKYFDVSLDYLVNGEEKNNKNNMNMGDNNFPNQDDNISFNKLTPQELEILKIYNSFDLKKQVIFLSKIFELENE